MTERRWWMAVAVLLACFVGLAARHVWDQDLTYDEATYFGLGGRILHDGRFEGAALLHPPLSFYVALLPQLVHGAPPVPGDARLVFAERMAVLLVFAVPLLLGVAWWSRTLYGKTAALAALALGAFCPTLLAHGPLLTPDAPLAATGFWAVFLYWRSGDGRRPWAWGPVLGLALLSKATALLFVGVIAALALARLRRGGAAVLVRLAAGGALAWLVLCAGYGFQGLFAAGEKAALVARTPARPALRALAAAVAPLLPLPYFNTLGRQVGVAASGWANYLLGEVSREGWRHYYVVALAVKETVPFLLLLGAALLSLRLLRPRREEWVLLAPFALFLTVFSLSHVQIGVRYLLPALPFLFVFTSRLALAEGRAARVLRVALPALLVAHAASVSLCGRDLISYFNEPSGGPARGWRLLADSNLDWGQNRSRAARWAVEHGGVADPRPLPAHGLVVLSTNRLAGILQGRGAYRLLRDEYAPLAMVAPNYVAYDLDHGRRFPLASMVTLPSGPGWRATAAPAAGWTADGFALADTAWPAAQPRGNLPDFVPAAAYPGTEGALMTCGIAEACAFRAPLTLPAAPVQAVLALATRGRFELSVNGVPAARGARCRAGWWQEDFRIERRLRAGPNVLALRVEGCGAGAPAAFVELRAALP